MTKTRRRGAWETARLSDYRPSAAQLIHNGWRPIYGWNVKTRPAAEWPHAMTELEARRLSGRNPEVWS